MTGSNKVAGIVNGTTNFILSAMDETGADYAETLAEAGRLGYAEADPTADVEGYDAAAKAAILASIAFHTRVTAARRVPRGHLQDHRSRPRRRRSALDCTIKLLAICERIVTPKGKERISARVLPGARSARAIRWPRSTARSTPLSSKPRTPAGSCSTARAQAAPPPLPR